MSTDDIEAAAERVRRVRHNGESLMVVYGSLTVETGGEAELEITHDVHRLADAYLAELDDTPIDEEFAEGVRTSSVELRRGPRDGEYTLWVFDDCRNMVNAFVKTRGQARSLLRAMGVTK